MCASYAIPALSRFPPGFRLRVRGGKGRGHTTHRLHSVERRIPALVVVALVHVSLAICSTNVEAQQTLTECSENPLLSTTIRQGAERSPTFRRLIEAINATDGLVYVSEDKCGDGVRTCLPSSLELSGPNRLLRIVVSGLRAPGCELKASVGHELQHALEVLRNPNIRTGFALEYS